MRACGESRGDHGRTSVVRRGTREEGDDPDLWVRPGSEGERRRGGERAERRRGETAARAGPERGRRTGSTGPRLRVELGPRGREREGLGRWGSWAGLGRKEKGVAGWAANWVWAGWVRFHLFYFLFPLFN